MNIGIPLVSLIMPTYNRSSSIERAINSALSQTYTNIELIIVDDGSTDNTLEIIKKYNDPRIRLVKHTINKGVTAAKNTGLNNIQGEWFTTLDSDDEIVPEAIETMMNIPLNIDYTVTAISCNCMDTSDGSFSGKGLIKDQYVDVDTLMKICSGEYWGITKSSLLMNDRFNENISGWESILWYKIDDRAKRYYIHKGLRIYHTEGNDRVSTSKYNIEKEIKLYKNYIIEVYYLEKIKKYRPYDYYTICKNGLITMRAYRYDEIASQYNDLMTQLDLSVLQRNSIRLFNIRLLSYAYIKLKILKAVVKG
jgi:GalNAc5-diNAcBac-PP-undecaprenol beta-1,3-glucosyltransferase